MQNSQSDQDKEQSEFLGWLAGQLKVKTHQELESKLKKMGSDGIKQAYQQFQQEKQKGGQPTDDDETDDDNTNDPTSFKQGGKLDYIKCLQAFKRGGAMEAKKCGCGDKMKKGGKAKMQDGGQAAQTDTGADTSQSLSKGGYMKGKQVGMKQMGGTATYVQGTPKKTIEVTKDDGSVGEWGNPLAQAPAKQYFLHKSSVSPVNQIDEGQVTYLRGKVPNFDKIVGQSFTRPGEVSRFGPDQSDAIRSMLLKYPMPTTTPFTNNNTPVVAMNKRGGKANDPSKTGHYTVPVSKAGSRMSELSTDDDKKGTDNPKGSTGIKPKWAAKAAKGKTKPKSVDHPQAHHKIKGAVANPDMS